MLVVLGACCLVIVPLLGLSLSVAFARLLHDSCVVAVIGVLVAKL